MLSIVYSFQILIARYVGLLVSRTSRYGTFRTVPQESAHEPLRWLVAVLAWSQPLRWRVVVLVWSTVPIVFQLLLLPLALSFDRFMNFEVC